RRDARGRGVDVNDADVVVGRDRDDAATLALHGHARAATGARDAQPDRLVGICREVVAELRFPRRWQDLRAPGHGYLWGLMLVRKTLIGPFSSSYLASTASAMMMTTYLCSGVSRTRIKPFHGLSPYFAVIRCCFDRSPLVDPSVMLPSNLMSFIVELKSLSIPFSTPGASFSVVLTSVMTVSCLASCRIAAFPCAFVVQPDGTSYSSLVSESTLTSACEGAAVRVRANSATKE